MAASPPPEFVGSGEHGPTHIHHQTPNPVPSLLLTHLARELLLLRFFFLLLHPPLPRATAGSVVEAVEYSLVGVRREVAEEE